MKKQLNPETLDCICHGIKLKHVVQMCDSIQEAITKNIACTKCKLCEQYLSDLFNCGVEQLVARCAHNAKVAGASPASATNFQIDK